MRRSKNNSQINLYMCEGIPLVTDHLVPSHCLPVLSLLSLIPHHIRLNIFNFRPSESFRQCLASACGKRFSSVHGCRVRVGYVHQEKCRSGKGLFCNVLEEYFQIFLVFFRTEMVLVLLESLQLLPMYVRRSYTQVGNAGRGLAKTFYKNAFIISYEGNP
jgi:hypothetical protein